MFHEEQEQQEFIKRKLIMKCEAGNGGVICSIKREWRQKSGEGWGSGYLEHSEYSMERRRKRRWCKVSKGVKYG